MINVKKEDVMEVSTQMNSFQMLNTYQQRREGPVTLPVEPKVPDYSPSEIYKASNGNLISDREGNLSLTPQGETNLNNIKNEREAAAAQEAEAAKDEKRANFVNYIGMQSKKTQAEIYLSVAADTKVDLGVDESTIRLIESLRDVQKQNNIVQAYASYKENQDLFNV